MSVASAFGDEVEDDVFTVPSSNAQRARSTSDVDLFASLPLGSKPRASRSRVSASNTPRHGPSSSSHASSAMQAHQAALEHMSHDRSRRSRASSIDLTREMLTPSGGRKVLNTNSAGADEEARKLGLDPSFRGGKLGFGQDQLGLNSHLGFLAAPSMGDTVASASKQALGVSRAAAQRAGSPGSPVGIGASTSPSDNVPAFAVSSALNTSTSSSEARLSVSASTAVAAAAADVLASRFLAPATAGRPRNDSVAEPELDRALLEMSGAGVEALHLDGELVTEPPPPPSVSDSPAVGAGLSLSSSAPITPLHTACTPPPVIHADIMTGAPSARALAAGLASASAERRAREGTPNSAHSAQERSSTPASVTAAAVANAGGVGAADPSGLPAAGVSGPAAPPDDGSEVVLRPAEPPSRAGTEEASESEASAGGNRDRGFSHSSLADLVLLMPIAADDGPGTSNTLYTPGLGTAADREELQALLAAVRAAGGRLFHGESSEEDSDSDTDDDTADEDNALFVDSDNDAGDLALLGGARGLMVDDDDDESDAPPVAAFLVLDEPGAAAEARKSFEGAAAALQYQEGDASMSLQEQGSLSSQSGAVADAGGVRAGDGAGGGVARSGEGGGRSGSSSRRRGRTFSVASVDSTAVLPHTPHGGTAVADGGTSTGSGDYATQGAVAMQGGWGMALHDARHGDQRGHGGAQVSGGGHVASGGSFSGLGSPVTVPLTASSGLPEQMTPSQRNSTSGTYMRAPRPLPTPAKRGTKHFGPGRDPTVDTATHFTIDFGFRVGLRLVSSGRYVPTFATLPAIATGILTNVVDAPLADPRSVYEIPEDRALRLSVTQLQRQLHTAQYGGSSARSRAIVWRGAYTLVQRKERIANWYYARRRRVWDRERQIKYDHRQKLANNRLRIKGRFVKAADILRDPELMAAAVEQGVDMAAMTKEAIGQMGLPAAAAAAAAMSDSVPAAGIVRDCLMAVMQAGHQGPQLATLAPISTFSPSSTPAPSVHFAHPTSHESVDDASVASTPTLGGRKRPRGPSSVISLDDSSSVDGASSSGPPSSGKQARGGGTRLRLNAPTAAETAAAAAGTSNMTPRTAALKSAMRRVVAKAVAATTSTLRARLANTGLLAKKAAQLDKP